MVHSIPFPEQHQANIPLVEESMDTDTKSTGQRQFLRAPSPSRDSSSPIPEQAGETSGREKRVRKSINYAEPKLNTYVPLFLLFGTDTIFCSKMRKPESGGESSRRKRSSGARTSIHKPPGTVMEAPLDPIVDDEKAAVPQTQTSRLTLPMRSDAENFPILTSRPGSAAAMYSPGPGSTTSSQSTTTVASSSSTSVTGTTESRQHKSRPQLPISDDDSDGTNADSEFGNGGHISSSSSNTWSNVNIDSGRRKGLPKRSAATAAVAALEDIRRHSMIV